MDLLVCRLKAIERVGVDKHEVVFTRAGMVAQAIDRFGHCADAVVETIGVRVDHQSRRPFEQREKPRSVQR